MKQYGGREESSIQRKVTALEGDSVRVFLWGQGSCLTSTIVLREPYNHHYWDGHQVLQFPLGAQM